MPKTKLTRGSFSTHFHYAKTIYIVIALLAWFVVDMAYTMSQYRSPKERKVEIQLVSEYSDTQGLEPIAEKALEDGQAFDETLEEVTFFSLMYSGKDDDVYGAQKYMVMLAAQEGHIYIMNRELLDRIVMDGGALPLDDYLASGALNVGDVDLSQTTYAEVLLDGEPATGAKRVYAIPATNLNGFLAEGIGFDARDKYIVVMGFVPNPDTTIAVLQSIIDQMTAPLPDWVQNEGAVTGDEKPVGDPAATEEAATP